MAVERVGASANSLHDLFQSHRYLIDVYQREYAWTADDVRILLNDLWESFEAYEQGGRRAREQVFLGPFVYVEAQPRTRYLVDGQQRFTTLHLIFLHLDRMAEERGAHRISGKLHAAVYEYFEEGKPTRYRLDIPERRWRRCTTSVGSTSAASPCLSPTSGNAACSFETCWTSV